MGTMGPCTISLDLSYLWATGVTWVTCVWMPNLFFLCSQSLYNILCIKIYMFIYMGNYIYIYIICACVYIIYNYIYILIQSQGVFFVRQGPNLAQSDRFGQAPLPADSLGHVGVVSQKGGSASLLAWHEQHNAAWNLRNERDLQPDCPALFTLCLWILVDFSSTKATKCSPIRWGLGNGWLHELMLVRLPFKRWESPTTRICSEISPSVRAWIHQCYAACARIAPFTFTLQIVMVPSHLAHQRKSCASCFSSSLKPTGCGHVSHQPSIFDGVPFISPILVHGIWCSLYFCKLSARVSWSKMLLMSTVYSIPFFRSAKRAIPWGFGAPASWTAMARWGMRCPLWRCSGYHSWSCGTAWWIFPPCFWVPGGTRGYQETPGLFLASPKKRKTWFLKVIGWETQAWATIQLRPFCGVPAKCCFCQCLKIWSRGKWWNMQSTFGHKGERHLQCCEMMTAWTLPTRTVYSEERGLEEDS